MADSGNQKVSHSAEPADQIAGIAAVAAPAQAGYPGTYTYTANGSLDTLFSDTVDLPAFQLYRGLYIGVGGNIKFQDSDGNICGPVAVSQGVLPFRKIKRIFATGTTATSVYGLR